MTSGLAGRLTLPMGEQVEKRADSRGRTQPVRASAKGRARLDHGARSSYRIEGVARNNKRRLLRQIGLRASDLDGIALGYLDAWARSFAKVAMMDAWVEEHGWVDVDGNPPPFASHYFTAVNSASRALSKLEDHLRQRGAEPSMVAILQGEARRLDT